MQIMSEVNTGIRSILKYGWVYRLSQTLFGERRSKQFIIDNYLKNLSTDTVLLDMGCGAGNFAHFIPGDINYIGFDPNENYIETARDNFSGRSHFKFYAGTAASQSVNEQITDASVDYAVVHGVLHHLSDAQIVQMYKMAGRVLKAGAKLIILEPVWYHGQSAVNKRVMQFDRGKNIKTKARWLDMSRESTDSWGTTEYQINNNLIRFYDLIIMEITKNQ